MSGHMDGLVPTALEVSRQDRGPGHVHLRLRGRLDADTAPDLMEALQALLAQGVRHVELDFTTVPFISSMGVGTIIAAVSEYREAGGDMVLVHLSQDLLAVFAMLGLLDYITTR